MASEFKTERLGELVVHRDRARRLDRLGDDVELGLLAGEVLGRIALRERDLDVAALALGDADQLVLEAGDEGVRADQHRDVAAAAAFERAAVDLAGEVDDHAVAGLGLGALGLGRERLVLVGDALDRLVDLVVGVTSALSRSSVMPLKSASSIAGMISMATV